MSLERVRLVSCGDSIFRGAVFRYDLLTRIAGIALRSGVTLVAFGIGSSEVRLVVEGDASAVSALLRGARSGTARVWSNLGGKGTFWFESIRNAMEESDLTDAVVWCHVAPVEGGANGPLASPWSSHRDLLSFRRAGFFDGEALAARVDALEVHRRCGGANLPDGWPPPGGMESLHVLLRVAGAVLGMMPADHGCFALFARLAMARGWRVEDVASALCLTPRRVRQLRACDAPMLATALVALGDPALRLVP